MITLLKIIFLIVLFLFFAYPLLPFSSKARRFSTFYGLRYEPPFNKRNAVFLPLMIIEFVVVALLFELLTKASGLVGSIPFIAKLTEGVRNQIGTKGEFYLLVIQVLLINIATIYAFVIVKGLLRHLLIDPILGWGKNDGLTPEQRRAKRAAYRRKRREEKRKRRMERREAKKNKSTRKKHGDAPDDENNNSEKNEEEEEYDSDDERVMRFPHSDGTGDDEDDNDEETDGESSGDAEPEPPPPPRSAFMRWLLGLMFEKDEDPPYVYARPSVARAAAVLQTFIYVVEVLYFLMFIVMAVAMLFPMPDWIYSLGVSLRRVYLYPFISLIFLQEIYNFLNTKTPKPKKPAGLDGQSDEDQKKDCDSKLLALTGELKKRFDVDHFFRYYPALPGQQLPEYVFSNKQYESALEYIRAYELQSSGHVVQSYLESLDAAYNDKHIYFGTSFYSEYGEYLSAYTYTRLLSGARMVFIASSRDALESLRRFIRDRLTRLTGCRDAATWRVYVSGERLDQADILIATPEDFRNDDIVRHYPGFFEEVCNAVFVDTDRVTAIYSYLCPIIAMRLQKATENRIRFIFLTRDVLRGFAARTLPRYFCVDKVFTASNALENESTAYMLINRESKSRRIYNHYRQSLTGLECILAQQAVNFGVDGVKIMSEAPIEYTDRVTLESQSVEINEFYKPVPVINYMIYSDENCNLASAIYTCTRFRGQQKSVANIISKPYLLRDYFVFMASNGDYINRSSFIQPRAVEDIDERKLSLLRVFCEASMGDGMTLPAFCDKMSSIIDTAGNRFASPLCDFCGKLFERIRSGEIVPTEKEYAEYLVAGLLDGRDTPADRSAGLRAKDYYLVTDPRYGISAVARDKWIGFRRNKDFLARLTERNRRVELRLNDQTVGYLDTFPDRVPQQYMVGQSIIFRNVEYEIGQISDDCRTIFLRSENVTFRNSLDTVFLRRYTVEDLRPFGDEGILYNTNTNLAEIHVSRARANILGESYGFFTLTTDNQTLDFSHGVVGNPWVGEDRVAENARRIKNGVCLTVSLRSRIECNDNMRLLIAVVFNEFIKTLFPHAYRLLAVCPVLENPVESVWSENSSVTEQIRALYPYLVQSGDGMRETDNHRIQLILINDCQDDVGILDWFYDGRAQYMREFLSHVYSYIQWLKCCGRPGTYIYFGEQALPECFDLDGCCRLFDGLGIILSDDGKDDFDTAGNFEQQVQRRRCAFCHRIVESGRYALFDHHRYICMDCFEVVHDEDQLKKLLREVREYLHKTYPEIKFGKLRAELDTVHDRKADEVLSEFSYRMDYKDRRVYIERDTPLVNARVVLLRALTGMWQHDNGLMIPAADGQLYYEELCYLLSVDRKESADWIRAALRGGVRETVEDITAYIEKHRGDNPPAPEPAEDTEEADIPDESDEEDIPENKDTGDGADGDTSNGDGSEGGDHKDDDPKNDNSEDDGSDSGSEPAPQAERYTSFRYMREKAAGISDEDLDGNTSDDDEKYPDKLYNPNKIPRFWKDYLRGIKATEKEDELSDEDRGTFDDDKLDDLGEGDGGVVPEEATGDDEDDAAKTEPDGGDTGVMSEDKSEDTSDGTSGEEPEKSDDESDGESGDDISGDTSDDTSEDSTDDDSDETPKGKKDKKSKKNKKDKKDKKSDKDGKNGKDSKDDKKDESDKSGGKGGNKDAERRLARQKKKFYDDDEETNPAIRLYNDILRHAYAFDDSSISVSGLTFERMVNIFYMVLSDWPELFWVSNIAGTADGMRLVFRCLDKDGKIDSKQVQTKLRELKKGARWFTRGITRRTRPYDAALKIYRRLILTLDYDTIGLKTGAGRSFDSDDRLRSLYSALVSHKVVCAGYAVAMQYLLQSVGISSGYVISEAKNNVCHAFNALRLGKYCYYLDATWGDMSCTDSEGRENEIYYNYFCVPYRDLVKTSPEDRHYHIPRHEFYPGLEEFTAARHEYFRHEDAYIDRYDEEQLIDLIVRSAQDYDPKEMGDFCIAMRCPDIATRDYIDKKLREDGQMFVLLAKARERLSRKKKAQALLECERYSSSVSEYCPTVYYWPEH